MPAVFTPITSLLDLCALVRGRRVVFFKGFGAPLDLHPPPPRLLDFLHAADIVAFDGDDFDRLSFTSALELLHRERPPPHPRLLAFKRAAEAPRLAAVGAPGAAGNWVGATEHCFLPERAAAASCFIIDDGDAAASAAAAAAAAPPLGGALGAAAAAGLAAPGVAYVRLGVRAVELVAARCSPAAVLVAAWGGSQIVAAEFALGLQLLGARMPRWHYWHATRTRGGERQEGQLRRLAPEAAARGHLREEDAAAEAHCTTAKD
jgi:hypothetical protein